MLTEVEEPMIHHVFKAPYQVSNFVICVLCVTTEFVTFCMMYKIYWRYGPTRFASLSCDSILGRVVDGISNIVV